MIVAPRADGMRAHEQMFIFCDQCVIRRIDEQKTRTALREFVIIVDVAELGAEEAGEADLESLDPGRAIHRLEFLRDERAGRARDVAIVESGVDEDGAYFFRAFGRVERRYDIVKRIEHSE